MLAGFQGLGNQFEMRVIRRTNMNAVNLRVFQNLPN
jgi:hypothetical protein